MNRSRFGDLEVICRTPAKGQTRPVPLLFIHGAYTGAWCWDEHFLDYFAGQGYACYALSLSGHGNSRRHIPLDTISLADYERDVAEVIAALPETPVLIGHSMGGMVVQKYLEQASVPAAVLLCSVPPQGLLGSAFGLMLSKPNLLSELNRIMEGKQPELESLRDALFHQPMDQDTLMRYYKLCQPESHRAIWDMSLFNLPFTLRMHKPPLLVMGAEHDVLIPPTQVRLTATTYGVEADILPDLGHGVMLEAGWRSAAEPIARWLDGTLADT